MTILIPAYQPDDRLISLIKNIKQICDYNIVVVDDGSGEAYKSIFLDVENEKVIVLTHKVNCGKGTALKTGITYIKKHDETEGIVCCDCDGQHLPEDIVKIATQVSKYKDCIVLGARHFTGKVPIRSRFGNTITRWIFFFGTGQTVYDTQTGLRGFSQNTFEWLISLDGERFEYEMNMLLEAQYEGKNLYEVEIKTVYENQHSSHFNTIKDSTKVFLPIIKFSAASLISAFIDYVLFILFLSLSKSLLGATVGARICSASCNYILNRTIVFSKGKASRKSHSLPKYALLVCVILGLNYAVIYFYYNILGIPITLAKVLTEITLFTFSYWAQKIFVFKHRHA